MVNWIESNRGTWNSWFEQPACDCDPVFTREEIEKFRSGLPLLLTETELNYLQWYRTVGCDDRLKEALVKHWSALAGVARWRDGDPPIQYPDQPPFSESDAQHVEAGLLFIRDCLTKYPSLGKHIDFLTAAVMFLIHDSAEATGESNSDVNLSNPIRLVETEADRVEKTQQEFRIFMEEILLWFPVEWQPMLARCARRYYSREENRNRGVPDTTADYTKLVDFYQGMVEAIKNVYPNPNLLPPGVIHKNLNVLPERIQMNVMKLFTLIQRIENDLFPVGSNQIDATAFGEWRDLVEVLIAPLRSNGYWRFALSFLKDFPEIGTLIGQFPPHTKLGFVEYLPPTHKRRRNAFS